MKMDEALPVAPRIPTDADIVQSRCDLGPEELAEIERAMAADVRDAHGDTVAAVWISATHPYANFVRTYEARQFEEAADVDPDYDLNQLYLAIVDTRNGANRAVHGASIMRSHIIDSTQLDETDTEARTGIYTIDSLIALGNFTVREFVEHYEEQGTDLERSIAVETNFKIHDDFEPFNGLGSADLTYSTLFNAIVDNGGEFGRAVTFATINSNQIRSFDRLGIVSAPLLGRHDFRTEEAELGGYSEPVAIEINEDLATIINAMDLVLPELVYVA